MEPFLASVSAIPAEGHDHCFRAGPPGKKLKWSRTPVEVMVAEAADYAASPMAISFSDWSALQRDPRIRAIAKGTGAESDVADLKGQLAEAHKLADGLRVELARAAEERESERAAHSEAERKAAAELQQASETIADLRQQLARKARPRSGE